MGQKNLQGKSAIRKRRYGESDGYKSAKLKKLRIYMSLSSTVVSHPLEFNPSTAPSTSKLFLRSANPCTASSFFVHLLLTETHNLFTRPKKSNSSNLYFTDVVGSGSIRTQVPLKGTNTDPSPKTATLIGFTVIAA